MKPLLRDRGFIALSLLAVANCAFMLLALTVWFGGSAKTPGVVDQFFGRVSGFRLDAVWLIVSSALLFLMGIACVIAAQRERAIWRTAVLCFTENAVFVVYLLHSFRAGLVDFG